MLPKRSGSGLVLGLREQGIPATAEGLSDFRESQREVWLVSPEFGRSDPNPVINSVGAMAGDMLIRELGLRWVIATDEYGTEVALHGRSGDILLYPMNAVAKRWTGEGDGTLLEFLTWTVSRVKQIQQEVAARAGGGHHR